MSRVRRACRRDQLNLEAKGSLAATLLKEAGRLEEQGHASLAMAARLTVTARKAKVMEADVTASYKRSKRCVEIIRLDPPRVEEPPLLEEPLGTAGRHYPRPYYGPADPEPEPAPAPPPAAKAAPAPDPPRRHFSTRQFEAFHKKQEKEAERVRKQAPIGEQSN